MNDKPFAFADAKPARGGTQTAAQPAPLAAPKAEIPRRRGFKPDEPPALPTRDFLAIVDLLNKHDIKMARRMIRALMEFWG